MDNRAAGSMVPPQFLPDLMFCGDRIVAAGRKGVAPHHTPDRQQSTENDPPFHNGIQSIARTGRRKAAGRHGLERGEKLPVETDGQQIHAPQKNDGARKDTPDAC